MVTVRQLERSVRTWRQLVTWLHVGVLLLLANPLWAWNALGHRLIAQIALDHLNPQTKALVYRYHRAFNASLRRRDSWVMSAVWLDRLYQRELAPWRAMHYIDYAFSEDGAAYSPPQKINALWAMELIRKILDDPLASDAEKGLALRMAMHIIGDLHQPLHTITKISAREPEGDRGGNRVKFKRNSIAPNLHAYWDRAGGFWMKHKHYSARDIQLLAKKMSRKAPCVFEYNPSPVLWAQESHRLARQMAYGSLPDHQQPDRAYQTMVRLTSRHQMLQAGCHLSSWLNVWVATPTHQVP